jgi:lipoate-protein ligase A
MSELLVAIEDGLTPQESLGASHYLMEALSRGRTDGSPWLLISRPKGSALVLGRYQDQRSAIDFKASKERDLPVVRRLSGGTTSLLSESQIHIALAVSMEEQPIECEPRQFLQKYGAVVVKGLVELGLRARYFGQDLISIKERPAGLLSFELDGKGAALLEAILAVSRPTLPDSELVGYPTTVRENPSADAFTTLEQEGSEISFSRIVQGLKTASAATLDMIAKERSLTPLEKERVRSLLRKVQVDEPKSGQVPPYLRRFRSRAIEESIGFVEATVGVTQGRFLKDVSIHGDFMADSGGIADLEQRLRMCPIKRRQVALIIDDVLGAPDHVILGIRRLGSILEAIMDAAKKGAAEAEG